MIISYNKFIKKSHINCPNREINSNECKNCARRSSHDYSASCCYEQHYEGPYAANYAQLTRDSIGGVGCPNKDPKTMHCKVCEDKQLTLNQDRKDYYLARNIKVFDSFVIRCSHPDFWDKKVEVHSNDPQIEKKDSDGSHF